MHLPISFCLLRPLFFVRLFFDNPLSWPSSLPPPSLYSFFSLILVLLVVADLPCSSIPCSTLQHFARSSSYFISCLRSLPVLSSRSLEFAIRLRKSRLPHHLGRATSDSRYVYDSLLAGNSLPRLRISRVIIDTHWNPSDVDYKWLQVIFMRDNLKAVSRTKFNLSRCEVLARFIDRLSDETVPFNNDNYERSTRERRVSQNSILNLFACIK